MNVTETQIEGLAQDFSISSVLAMELLHSCGKPSKYGTHGIWLLNALAVISL